MFHPLLNDLSELNDQELNDRAQEISRKLSSVYRVGANPGLIQQMQLVNAQLQDEVMFRQRKELEKLMDKNGKDFKNIIDIK
tara:strand:- start:409 stop:654 length:246 start_codon:yes stop_codon:yes gene_type:complete